jgi:RNA polymerase sigma-70 factor (ECF subfamily)
LTSLSGERALLRIPCGDRAAVSGEIDVLRTVSADTPTTEASFRELYDRHRREVFGFLVRLLRDEALAEDVLQETFLRVYRALDQYDPERSFRAWVFQIARNAALDALRLARKEEKLREASARRQDGAAPDVVPEVSRREDAARTRGALDELPPDARALLLQRHGLGMSIAELSESWSVTERTVMNRLKGAVLLLAKALLERGAGPAPEIGGAE